jgi:hypothetical protein
LLSPFKKNESYTNKVVILVSYGVFKLATGDEIELPIFWGKISIQLIEKMKENLKLFRIFLFVSRQ